MFYIFNKNDLYDSEESDANDAKVKESKETTATLKSTTTNVGDVKIKQQPQKSSLIKTELVKRV